MCFIICLLRAEAWLLESLHFLHLCGFSPEWTREWVFKLSFLLNDLSHSVHLYFFTSLWVFLCSESLFPLANIIWHKSQDMCFDIFNGRVHSLLVTYYHCEKSQWVDWIGFTSGYLVATALRIVYWPTPFLNGWKKCSFQCVGFSFFQTTPDY